MKKLFVIPGWKHLPSDKTYKWMKDDLSKKYDIEIVRIDWNRKVMSDYVEQFSEIYEKKKARTNYVLGFSFGAMIAFISAVQLKPKKLLLCSLSPYFAEDLPKLKSWWLDYIGEHRLADFKKIRAKDVAKKMKSPTTVFIGEKEKEKYSRLKYRCEKTARDLGAKLVVVADAPHDVAHPEYRKRIIESLT